MFKHEQKSFVLLFKRTEQTHYKPIKNLIPESIKKKYAVTDHLLTSQLRSRHGFWVRGCISYLDQ